MFKITVLVALLPLVYSIPLPSPNQIQAAGIPKSLVTPIDTAVNVVNGVLEVLGGAESGYVSQRYNYSHYYYYYVHYQYYYRYNDAHQLHNDDEQHHGNHENGNLTD